MGILSKLFGGQEPDYYDEGYTDGGTYREERPNLDRKGFAEAQISASEVNQNELGYKDHEDAIWQAGFVDGYNSDRHQYGDSHPSLNDEEERPWWKKIW